MSIELLKRLIELVPGRDEAEMVVDIAGLPSDKIDFSGSSKTMWHKILREAKKHNNGISNIIEAVLLDYNEDPVLLKIKNTPPQNTNPEDPDTQDDPVSLDQIDIDELKTLVAQDKIEKVLKILNATGDELDSDIKTQLILFQGRYSKLKTDNTNGILTPAELNMQKSRLRVSLLSIIDTITE